MFDSSGVFYYFTVHKISYPKMAAHSTIGCLCQRPGLMLDIYGHLSKTQLSHQNQNGC